MRDKFCSNLMNTECSKDYKKKHFWERRGLFKDNNDIEMVWQCTQCDLCVLENLEFMNEPKFKSDDTEVAEREPNYSQQVSAKSSRCEENVTHSPVGVKSADSVPDGQFKSAKDVSEQDTKEQIAHELNKDYDTSSKKVVKK